MSRQPRNLRADSLQLERRRLLAAIPAPVLVGSLPVQFVNPTGSTGLFPTQVVTQQAGEATVWLSRKGTAGGLQVRVVTDPDSPAVGVNLGAVDQTVTFADGQGLAAVAVPILPGAPNPGEVDVFLNIRPIDPRTDDNSFTHPMSLDLEIVASDPTSPPRVVSAITTAHGIVVSFNKPMDPAGASDVDNYAVSAGINHFHTPGGVFGISLGSTKTSVTTVSERLRSARYDPATQSTTLVLKQQDLNIDWMTNLKQIHPAKIPARPGHHAVVSRGITDVQGNPINADTNPGQIAFRLSNPIISYGL